MYSGDADFTDPDRFSALVPAVLAHIGMRTEGLRSNGPRKRASKCSDADKPSRRTCAPWRLDV